MLRSISVWFKNCDKRSWFWSTLIQVEGSKREDKEHRLRLCSKDSKEKPESKCSCTHTLSFVYIT